MATITSLLAALFLTFATSTLEVRADNSIIASCKHDFAYTFDNGPYLWEEEIVDEFDCAAAQTTFFVNGNHESCIYSDDNVQRLRYAFEAGHQIASGGWSGADFSTLSNAQIDIEIQRLDDAIINILGVKPKVFRAQSLSDDAAAYITTTYGKTVVSSDEDDTSAGATTGQDIYQFYQGLANQGQGHPHLARSDESQSISLDALDLGTVELFVTAGIRLVTVAQCLDIPPYEVVGNYGIRDDSWTCDGSWSPPTAPTCAQTYTATASDKTCAAIAAKFGVTAQAVYLANPFLNCQDVWAFTPVCIPAAPAPTPQITCAQNYNTVAGDTCTTIAAKFGITTEALFGGNSFLTCNDIWANTPICIPSGGTNCVSQYVAGDNETCITVANKFGLSATAIYNSNAFIACDNIWKYTNLCIPPGGRGCTNTITSWPGATCDSIASAYGQTSATIQLWNSFVDCSNIWTNTPICVAH